MRVLWLGSAGQVGYELRQRLGTEELSAPGRGELDLRNPDAVRRTTSDFAPEVIVNAAAYTAVDRAEEEREEANLLNAKLPAVLAEECARSGALLVHYSTDYVYSGEKREPYVEEDATGPLNEYGWSKLRGDEAILASGARALIFRTSWVFSARRANFVRTMLRLGAERDAVRVVGDQRGCPTSAAMIAEATVRALRQESVEGPEVFHLAGVGESSWREFAEEICERARGEGLPGKAEVLAMTS